MSKVYNLAEVSQHNTHKDCWVVIDGKVYDVTSFLEYHPGGDEVLLTSTGKDATEDFEDVGHSATARATMEKLYVGDINTSTMPTKKTNANPKPKFNQDTSSGNIIKLLQILVPLVVLGVAVALSFYIKSSA